MVSNRPPFGSGSGDAVVPRDESDENLTKGATSAGIRGRIARSPERFCKRREDRPLSDLLIDQLRHFACDEDEDVMTPYSSHTEYSDVLEM
eukprot:scaffold9338_cov113-Isochrysis_galbana.AAC.4